MNLKLITSLILLVGPTTAQPLNQHARDLASIRSDVNRSQREGENILRISLIEQS